MVVISSVKNMFWGVTIDAGKRYSQVVTQGFHLSMAALEPGTASNDYVQVMVQHGSAEFLLCSLHQNKIIQQPLDLVFASGEELSFSLTGKGVVHLTGYLLDADDDFDDEYSEEDESDAPQLIEIDSDSLKTGTKRKAIESSSLAKKKKLSEDSEDEDDDDDDDDDDDEEDDEDFSEDELTFDEDESDLNDDDDGDDDDDEDDEDDDEDMDDDDEEEMQSPVKATVVTPKGDGLGSAKKEKAKVQVQQSPSQKSVKTPTSVKKENSQKTPASGKKENSQKSSTENGPKQSDKAPETPNTPANGESAKKKRKRKKNKGGDASMNESTASSPEKSGAESTPKSTPKAKGQNGGTPKADTPGKRKVVSGGTVIEDIKVGHGPEAKAGKMVAVYYVGTLSKNNKQFDSCSSGKPFRFRLKQGEVIKGWDNGVEGMKVGGKRKITVPANQAYGNQRQGPIPPNSALTFEVELKAVS